MKQEGSLLRVGLGFVDVVWRRSAAASFVATAVEDVQSISGSAAGRP